MPQQCFTWSELGEEWIGALYPWSDVCIIVTAEAAISGGAAGFFDEPHRYLEPQAIIKDQLDPKDFKRFIEIVCTINGISTSQTKERKINGLPVVTISEITRAINEVRDSEPEKYKTAIKLKGIRREDI
jgi:hypothetical protein